MCPGAWKLGSYEPKTVAVVQAKPAGSAHHPGPGDVGCHPWPHLAIRCGRAGTKRNNQAVSRPRFAGVFSTATNLAFRVSLRARVCESRGPDRHLPAGQVIRF